MKINAPIENFTQESLPVFIVQEMEIISLSPCDFNEDQDVKTFELNIRCCFKILKYNFLGIAYVQVSSDFRHSGPFPTEQLFSLYVVQW